MVVVAAILVEPGVDYVRVVRQNYVVRVEVFGAGTGNFGVGTGNFGAGTGNFGVGTENSVTENSVIENSVDGTEGSATGDVVPEAPAAPSHQANLDIFLPLC